MQVLIVDDDTEIVEILDIYLQNEGYQVFKAYDGEAAIAIIQAETQLDLVIMDIMMPKVTGLEVLAYVRQERKTLPVILLSAKSTDNDKIQGLISGADDYITKPFNPLEVVARAKSLRRRLQDVTSGEQGDTIQLPSIIIYKDLRVVKTLSGVQVQLTSLEFAILYLLASHPNQVFSTEEIFAEVWKGETGGSSKTVMVHVKHLRDKLSEATDGDQVVQTVWGVGYKIER